VSGAKRRQTYPLKFRGKGGDRSCDAQLSKGKRGKAGKGNLPLTGEGQKRGGGGLCWTGGIQRSREKKGLLEQKESLDNELRKLQPLKNLRADRKVGL